MPVPTETRAIAAVLGAGEAILAVLAFAVSAPRAFLAFVGAVHVLVEETCRVAVRVDIPAGPAEIILLANLGPRQDAVPDAIIASRGTFDVQDVPTGEISFAGIAELARILLAVAALGLRVDAIRGAILQALARVAFSVAAERAGAFVEVANFPGSLVAIGGLPALSGIRGSLAFAEGALGLELGVDGQAQVTPVEGKEILRPVSPSVNVPFSGAF